MSQQFSLEATQHFSFEILIKRIIILKSVWAIQRFVKNGYRRVHAFLLISNLQGAIVHEKFLHFPHNSCSKSFFTVLRQIYFLPMSYLPNRTPSTIMYFAVLNLNWTTSEWNIILMLNVLTAVNTVKSVILRIASLPASCTGEPL